MIDIVLTGTIVPQSNFVGISNFEERRREYLRCIRFYRDFGKIYFLENSQYDIDADPDFNIPDVTIVKFRETDRDAYSLGKGFQEFKMLDQFVRGEQCPAAFFKITGRRLIPNFSDLLSRHPGQQGALFDIVRRHRIADTSLFFCTKKFYLDHIVDAYKEVNDAKGAWIERVLYKRFHARVTTELFRTTPLFDGRSGSTGGTLKYPKWKLIVRNLQRRMWPIFGFREL